MVASTGGPGVNHPQYRKAQGNGMRDGEGHDRGQQDLGTVLQHRKPFDLGAALITFHKDSTQYRGSPNLIRRPRGRHRMRTFF